MSPSPAITYVNGQRFFIAFVEPRRQVRLGNGHAHGVGQSLSERPRGNLHAGRVPVFGMTRRAASPLAEVFDVVHREVVAGQMQKRIEKHGGMTGGKHKAVAVGPERIFWIVFEMPRPERERRGGGAQRHAGMAGFGLFNRVGRQKNGWYQ